MKIKIKNYKKVKSTNDVAMKLIKKTKEGGVPFGMYV